MAHDSRETETKRSTSEPRPAGNGSDGPILLTINAGSSSLKFSLFRATAAPARIMAGKIDRIGLSDTTAALTDLVSHRTQNRSLSAPDHMACLEAVADWLIERVRFEDIAAAGHRVVHGGIRFDKPQRITPAMLAEMRRLGPYNPGHFPAQIGLIEALGRRHPDLPQVACFDTAFHRDMPRVAQLLPLPRRYDAMGIRRYGFHGLSYAFLMEELERLEGPQRAHGRVILAHLGNGASMAAVREGRGIDTTMAFTPTSGLVMSTRTGDLDPGIFAFLAKTESMSADDFQTMVNTQSGLRGVSETSSDMRDLLAREKADPRAAEAVELFCYQARKWIGALAAALGGLDVLVFSGGIGENSPEVRERICRGLEFLGIEIDPASNGANEAVISPRASRVATRVIRTDEEVQIARSLAQMLAGESR